MSIAISEKLRALPVQLVETPSGMIVKRGSTELRLTGDGISEVLQRILWAATIESKTAEELTEQFGASSRPAIRKLIDELVERRILASARTIRTTELGSETNLEIFYWHFGEPKTIGDELNSRRFAILGLNAISRQLVTTLTASNIANIVVVDFPFLRNLRIFGDRDQPSLEHWPRSLCTPMAYKAWMEESDDKSQDCIVGTSDFGNHHVLREWNKFCLDRNCHFLPVVLHNVIGYIGPLVIPGETPCLECLRRRQDSHAKDKELDRAMEDVAFQGQKVVGFHPAMASILGDIAAFEVTRFYSRAVPGANVGTFIEVNLLATYVTARKILKVPRCPACSVLNRQSAIGIHKQTLQPTSDVKQ